MSNLRTLGIALTCATIAAIAAAILWPRAQQSMPAPSFAGTEVCASCHQDQFARWQKSHHRHAMEVADAKSVLGDFKDAKFDYFGTTSRFFQRDGQYFVETDNAKGVPEAFRVAYTFGWYPLQQYLVKFPDGRMQALSLTWDSRPAAEGGQRWYHLYPGQQVTHDDPLHWTGAFQNWNSRCAACHSTNIVRNYSEATNRYNTTWQELNVGCEACHGPGSRHVAWARDGSKSQDNGLMLDLRRSWTPEEGRLPIPPSMNQEVSPQLQVCAGCHSRRGELQHPQFTAGLFDNYSLSPLLEGLYYADGQMHDEVYEIGSFLQSRMNGKHVSCSNCHEPHGGELRATGNALCTQCHQAPEFRSGAHGFHKPDSPGAQCVSCHMPQHTYMGVDVRHDHSFRIPDPAASKESGVPNACRQCHANRSDSWAAQAIANRSGHSEPRYTHARLLAAARSNDARIAPDLLAYAGDAQHPAILRSIVLLESGRFPSAEQLAAITSAMKSPDPMIRVGAASAVGSLDAGQRLSFLQPLLQDSARAVRNVVARQLMDVPLSRAPENIRPTLGKLFDEYRQTLLHNADMPESMSDLGLFYAAQGDADAAEKALLQARSLAPRYLAGMLNLADLYRARNRDDLAEPVLREGLEEYPESGDVHHMLGLLYVRTGRTQQSVPLLRRAAKLSPANARYTLVYALALIETGQRPQGLAALQEAAKRFPDDEPIRQALTAYRSGSAH